MECPICLADIETPITMECCNKSYCSKCIIEWVKVRNICPLCCKATGTESVNTLQQTKNEQFDDGFLILETEMKQLLDRLHLIKDRVSYKRSQLSCIKSATSASLVSYLQVELDFIEVYRANLYEQYLTHNRAGAVHSMQLITEGIIKIESSLKTNSALVELDSEDQCFENESCESEDEYFDYEVEVKYSRPNKLKSGVPSKNKNTERRLGV